MVWNQNNRTERISLMIMCWSMLDTDTRAHPSQKLFTFHSIYAVYLSIVEKWQKNERVSWWTGDEKIIHSSKISFQKTENEKPSQKHTNTPCNYMQNHLTSLHWNIKSKMCICTACRKCWISNVHVCWNL